MASANLFAIWSADQPVHCARERRVAVCSSLRGGMVVMLQRFLMDRGDRRVAITEAMAQTLSAGLMARGCSKWSQQGIFSALISMWGISADWTRWLS